MEGFALVESQPGSLTLAIKRLKNDVELARNIYKRFSNVKGIKQVEADPAAGLVRVEYDKAQLSSLLSLFALQQAFANTFPEVDSLQLAGWLRPHI